MEAKSGEEWWKHTIVYQVYPRSFQDSNGDGIGDLKGIQSRLDYFQYLGVQTLWLSPIYKSPMADFGYDVSDYCDIDPQFGTLTDLDDLIKDIHSRGMYLVMDFVPNHTSDQHDWFLESRKGGENNPYSDYYIWTSGKVLEDGTRAPPNNWLSIFGGSAWEWVEERQQYYYHQFVKQQPDLNYRNPTVRREMENVLRFWLDRGVDGFRVDAIDTLFEVEDLSLDEPRSNSKALPHQHSYLDHPYTKDLPEIHEVVREWRDVIDAHDSKSGRLTFMVMEVYDKTLVETMKYYHSGAAMPFNFHLIIHINQTTGGEKMRDLVDAWMTRMPEGKWANFVLSNHDNSRMTSRKGPEYSDALNLMLLTLPGTPTTYYGEELGLRDIEVSYKDTQDPYGINMGPELYTKYSRDPCRAPMQWSSEKNAGFSSAAKTWLPVHPDYVTRNVEAQKGDLSGLSSVELYRQTSLLRREPTFRTQNIKYLVCNENIFSFLRYKQGHDAYLVALNLGKEVSTDDYTGLGDVSKTGLVVLCTQSFSRQFKHGQILNLSELTLKPGDAVIVKLSKSAKV